jgi:hypothetical protein
LELSGIFSAAPGAEACILPGLAPCIASASQGPALLQVRIPRKPPG